MDSVIHILSRSANKVRFCNCVLKPPDEHVIKRTQTTETSETSDSTIRKPISALRFEGRKNHQENVRKNSSQKIRCTDDKHDHRKARGQAIPNLPALAPQHPLEGESGETAKNKKFGHMRRNTRITKIREGGERGGGGLSESRAQSSFATLKSKRHSSLDCRKLLLIKLHPLCAERTLRFLSHVNTNLE